MWKPWPNQRKQGEQSEQIIWHKQNHSHTATAAGPGSGLCCWCFGVGCGNNWVNAVGIHSFVKGVLFSLWGGRLYRSIRHTLSLLKHFLLLPMVCPLKLTFPLLMQCSREKRNRKRMCVCVCVLLCVYVYVCVHAYASLEKHMPKNTTGSTKKMF